VAAVPIASQTRIKKKTEIEYQESQKETLK
jgi:hypothetical protein